MNSSGQKEGNCPVIGIIGGTGMETFPELKEIRRSFPTTPYGHPSDEIVFGEWRGKEVRFIPRHGSKHVIPPHKIPYKANLFALKEAGAEYVIGTCIVGSLKKDIEPGAFVIPDQFVNFTWGRDDAFEMDHKLVHLPMADPYCAHVRQSLVSFAVKASIPIRPVGTVVVIQGPRFSTAAESRWFSKQGWDIINMTQYPECYFARELGVCYASLASVTDYDCGLQDSLVIDPIHAETFLKVFRANIRKTKDLLLSFLESPLSYLSCSCAKQVIKAYYQS